MNGDAKKAKTNLSNIDKQAASPGTGPLQIASTVHSKHFPIKKFPCIYLFFLCMRPFGPRHASIPCQISPPSETGSQGMLERKPTPPMLALSSCSPRPTAPGSGDPRCHPLPHHAHTLGGLAPRCFPLRSEVFSILFLSSGFSSQQNLSSITF